jgi:hypothetical protein
MRDDTARGGLTVDKTLAGIGSATAAAAVAAGSVLTMGPPAIAAPALPADGAAEDTALATSQNRMSCNDSRVAIAVQYTRESSRAHITYWFGGVAATADARPAAGLISSWKSNYYAIPMTYAYGPDPYWIEGKGSAYSDYGHPITVWVQFGGADVLCTTTVKR